MRATAVGNRAAGDIDVEKSQRKALWAERVKAKLPDGKDWVGKNVAHCPHQSSLPEKGVVVKMATGKALAMFVHFAGEASPRYCYASNIELID